MSALAEILICDDPESTAHLLKEEFTANRVVLLIREEFGIEDAKEAIKEAYIASEKEKLIVLAAKKFNIYSQNALLKILEEPPKNILFKILCTAKSSLLPTIRSRLPVRNLKKRDAKPSRKIEKIDLEEILNMLKQERIEAEEAKESVYEAFRLFLRSEPKPGAKTLEAFEESLKLLELNSNPKTVLLRLYLNILKSRR